MCVIFRGEEDKLGTYDETYECQCIEDENSPPDPECTVCNGTGKVVFTSTKGEITYNNRNAEILLDMLGMHTKGDDLTGELEHSDLHLLMRSIMKSINTGKPYENAVDPHSTHNVYTFGLNVERIFSMLSQLRELTMLCQSKGSGLYWS